MQPAQGRSPCRWAVYLLYLVVYLRSVSLKIHIFPNLTVALPDDTLAVRVIPKAVFRIETLNIVRVLAECPKARSKALR